MFPPLTGFNLKKWIERSSFSGVKFRMGRPDPYPYRHHFAALMG